MMDELQELERLILAAEKNLPTDSIYLMHNANGFSLVKTGAMGEDYRDHTFSEVVAKLREWAVPRTVTITVPMKDALAAVDGNFRPNNMAYPVIELLKAAIKGAKCQS